MANYRIYPLNSEGKIAGGYSFAGADDHAAIIYAGTLGFGLVPFEIWCGTRFFFPLSIELAPRPEEQLA